MSDHSLSQVRPNVPHSQMCGLYEGFKTRRKLEVKRAFWRVWDEYRNIKVEVTGRVADQRRSLNLRVSKMAKEQQSFQRRSTHWQVQYSNIADDVLGNSDNAYFSGDHRC